MPSRDLAASLASRVRAVTDPQVRVGLLRSTLRALSPLEVAELFTVVQARAEARDAEHADLLLAACLALADPECAELRDQVVDAARTQKLDDVARMLEPRAPTGDDGEPRVPDFGAGRPLTVGERKSLARRSDRNLLTRVLLDPSPDVIRILLGNPRITEDDVVRLCARRPIASDVLREVFRNLRWIVRHRVRIALVRNPYAPLDLALQLASLLPAEDARTVADSPDLAPALRDACSRIAGDVTVH